MTERWRSVSGYDGLEVSDHGRVRRDGVLRKPYAKIGDYVRLVVSYNREIHCFRVHRLVAESFVSGRVVGTQVHHKDGDRHNNHWSNLEWITAKENVREAVNRGYVTGRNVRLSPAQVRAIRTSLASGATVTSMARFYGVAKPTIRGIKSGTTWKHIDA